MDENYIPGFTNHLYSAVPDYGMYAGQPQYNDVTMYGEKVGSPYGLMSDEYNVPVGTMGGDVMLGNDLAVGAPAAGPTTAVTSPYAKPSLTPGLDFATDRGGQQGYYFVTNAGRAAKTKANPTGFVSADPNAQYRLVNERGQNVVVTSGSGEQGLRDAYAAAQRLSTEGGTKANWYLERSGPEGNWTRIADDDPKGSDLGVAGKILGAALPIATAFIPGLGVLGTIAMQAASGAAGSALAGGDPLKGAVIGGLTAGGGQVLGPAIRGATNLGANAAGAIGTGIGATAGGLATGQNLKNSLLGGLASGATSYFAPGVLEKLGIQTPGAPGGSTYSPDTGITVTPTTQPNIAISGGSGSAPRGDAGADNLGAQDIVVTGAKAPPLSLPASIFTDQPSLPIPMKGQGPTPLDTLGFTGAEMQPETLPEDEIVVSGTKAQPLSPYAPVSVPDIKAPGTLGLTGAELAPTQPEQEIVVSGANAPSLSPYVPAPGLTGSRPNMGFTGARDGATAPEEGGTSLKDIVDYLRLAGLATSTLGGLVGGGGGGGGSNFRMPSGTGALNSVFSSKLPTPNLPGGVGGGGTGARTAADLAGQGLSSPIDYYRYGYGPEQSFFNYAPQGEPNKSEAYTGYAEGGFAVEGPGDGRDDKIPALLSDGEYVIDAETVALLGDGSSRAGAKKLDDLRIKVRKHKGKNLAQGKFSVNARNPEAYMLGGRI